MLLNFHNIELIEAPDVTSKNDMIKLSLGSEHKDSMKTELYRSEYQKREID